MPPIPPLIGELKQLKGGVGNLLVHIRNLTYPKQGRDPSMHRSVASLPRFGPLLKKSWLCQLYLFMFARYISRYHSVRKHTFSMNMYFLLTFFLLIISPPKKKKSTPKCAPDRSISISKMHTLPPLGREAPSLAFFPRILQILPPPPTKNSCVRPCVCIVELAGLCGVCVCACVRVCMQWRKLRGGGTGGTWPPPNRLAFFFFFCLS